MLVINKDNFREVIEIVSRAIKRSEYNTSYFSTGEVLRNHSALNSFDKLCDKLEQKNIVFEKHIAPICIEQGVIFSEKIMNESLDDIDFESIPNDLYLEIDCSAIEYFFINDEKKIITAGYEKPIKYKYYKELQTHSDRYSYQLWDINKESIDTLKSIKKVNDVFESSKKYIENMEIVGIEILRDLYSDTEIDCSEILLKYYDSINDKLIYVAASIGGFYKDIVIGDDNTIIISIPLNKDIEPWLVRTVKKEKFIEIDYEKEDAYIVETKIIKHTTLINMTNLMRKYENLILKYIN